MSSDLVVSAAVRIPALELEWTAMRASGPGGQNVNKVSSKVELRFDLRGSQVLSAAVKARLRQAFSHRLDAEGRLVIRSQLTRDQTQNLADARKKLGAMIRAALVPPKRRRATRPTLASKQKRLEGKRLQSKKKQARSRPRGED
jgi:ribosome-associated protein